MPTALATASIEVPGTARSLCAFSSVSDVIRRGRPRLDVTGSAWRRRSAIPSLFNRGSGKPWLAVPQ